MKYSIFETFVGAGGSHIGFSSEGFETKYVNDFSKECLQTLVFNNPHIKDTAIIDDSSILDIDLESIKEQTKFQIGELDVLFGGIVCKGFSLAGERSPNDERNYYYHKQLEIVEVFKPKVSVIENVPGIVNARVLAETTPIKVKEKVDELWQQIENFKGQKAEFRKQSTITRDFEDYGSSLRKEKEEILDYLETNGYLISVIDDINLIYKKLGYKVYSKKLNSSSFGAATRRERIIIVAVRNDIPFQYEFPEPTHADNYLLGKYPNQYRKNARYLKTITVGDAIKNVKIDEEDIDSLPMKHSQKTIERFRFIKQGSNVANIIDELPEHLKISKFYSRGNTMRLKDDETSPTLVPGHSNFPIHPYEDRSITVREAALISGFPDGYKFFGSHTKRCEQVGNAVTPPLSKAIARSVKKILDDFYREKLLV